MKPRLEMVSVWMLWCFVFFFPMPGVWGGWGKEEFEEEIAAAWEFGKCVQLPGLLGRSRQED